MTYKRVAELLKAVPVEEGRDRANARLSMVFDANKNNHSIWIELTGKKWDRFKRVIMEVRDIDGNIVSSATTDKYCLDIVFDNARDKESPTGEEVFDFINFALKKFEKDKHA